VRLAQAMLPQIREGGVIAFMSSNTASFTNNETGDMALYRASKSALNSLARSFAVTLFIAHGRNHIGARISESCGKTAPNPARRANNQYMLYSHGVSSSDTHPYVIVAGRLTAYAFAMQDPRRNRIKCAGSISMLSCQQKQSLSPRRPLRRELVVVPAAF